MPQDARRLLALPHCSNSDETYDPCLGDTQSNRCVEFQKSSRQRHAMDHCRRRSSDNRSRNCERRCERALLRRRRHDREAHHLRKDRPQRAGLPTAMKSVRLDPASSGLRDGNEAELRRGDSSKTTVDQKRWRSCGHCGLLCMARQGAGGAVDTHSRRGVTEFSSVIVR